MSATVTDRQILSVRDYLPADIDALIDLFRASVRMVARRDYSHEQVMAWAPDDIDPLSWAARNAHRRAWVAEIDGKVAGFTDLEPDGHLGMMYAHPAYQGRGVATALLEHVEAAARQSGLARLYTEASITARPFFERRGFQVIAAQTASTRGQDFVNYRMEKHLFERGVTASPSPAVH
jgi:putative acetyltransferase